jgi:hypothetical protein
MAIPEFHNSRGEVDLALLTPEACAAAAMSDDEAAVLAIVVDAIQNEDAANARLAKAKQAARDAMRIEAEKFALHQQSSPPQTRLEALKAAQDAYNGVAPAKPTSHKKYAVVGPEREWRKAEADTLAAQDELRAATSHAQRCQKLVGSAMAELLSIAPPPSADDVHRAAIAREQAVRIERVAKGLPAEEKQPAPVAQTPLDQLYANRGKSNDRLSRKRVNHASIRGPLFKV